MPALNTPSSDGKPGRRLWPLDVAGTAGLLAYAGLAVLTRAEGAMALRHYFGLLGVAWLALLAAWAWRAEGRGLVRRIWFWGVAFRLVGLWGQPVLEDDWARYLWDGRQFATVGTPYASAPLEHFADEQVPPEFQRLLDQINHPDVPTIYGPVCQFVFLLSYGTAPAQLWPLKLALVLADLLTLGLLLRATRPGYALLYAWCPLVIQETAFSAHPDALGIFFAVAALVAFQKQRWPWVAVCLALGGGARIYALLLAPFLLWPAPRRYWLLFAAALAALHAPFWWQGAGANGLSAFARHWEFNSFAFAVVAPLAGVGTAKVVCGLLFLAFASVCFWNWRERAGGPRPPWPRGDWLFGAFFLLSPVVNPWYLLWLVPFVARTPSAAGVTALAVVSLSYATGMNLGDPSLGAYAHPGWVRPAEFSAVLLAALWDWRRAARSEGEAD